MSDVNPLAVTDVRPFVPAVDFHQSLAFYTALGWTTLWSDDDGLALLSLAGSQLMLQDFYVKDWAENSMLVVEVADAAAWYRHIGRVLADGDLGNARVAEPQQKEWGALVTYVWDPCGVLLHFTQLNS
ncbi:MAG: hypothetical protein WEB78_09835 [Ilumatobacteraceae bacterium]